MNQQICPISDQHSYEVILVVIIGETLAIDVNGSFRRLYALLARLGCVVNLHCPTEIVDLEQFAFKTNVIYRQL